MIAAQITCFVLGMMASVVIFGLINVLFMNPKKGACPRNPSGGDHAYSPHETARNNGVPLCIWCGEVKPK